MDKHDVGQAANFESWKQKQRHRSSHHYRGVSDTHHLAHLRWRQSQRRRVPKFEMSFDQFPKFPLHRWVDFFFFSKLHTVCTVKATLFEV